MEFNNYIQSLFEILNNIESTNIKGEKIESEESVISAIEMIREVNRINGKVIFIGNGGSDSIASHGAIDFLKNLGIKSICLNNSSAITCFSNDYGYDKVFEKPIEILLDSKDLLIAISSSGNSSNMVNAVNKARTIKAKTITLSGFKKNNQLRSLGDINFYVPSLEYGMVELSHQTIIHMISDEILKEKQVGFKFE